MNLMRQITDWDDAYANVPNIPGGEAYPGRWAEEAGEFRSSGNFSKAELKTAYGPGDRNWYDLYMPDGDPRGTLVFVHGGYWMRFSPDEFSHFAASALANGWSVAMPCYTLCPDIGIAGITSEIGNAVSHIASVTQGPIVLSGHSAGGHLVTRMVCKDTPLAPGVIQRIERVMSISGAHDLRPLLAAPQNDVLKMDGAMAAAESPALHWPVSDTELICWVGGGERAEFLRQNALLANVWLGLGAATQCIEEPDRHHFSVIEGLRHANSPIARALLGS